MRQGGLGNVCYSNSTVVVLYFEYSLDIILLMANNMSNNFLAIKVTPLWSFLASYHKLAYFPSGFYFEGVFY